MTLSVEPDHTDHPDPAEPAGGFEVRTARCDRQGAAIRMSGDVTAGAAAVLAEVLDGHLRAGRRFLRLHVGGVRQLSEEAVTVIARAHDRLLRQRGTIVLTGVGEPIEAALRVAAPSSPLFLLAPTAADRAMQFDA
jgi:anti-anti-sigma regulatory factor